MSNDERVEDGTLSNDERVEDGTAWREFCAALSRAGDVVLRDASPDGPLDYHNPWIINQECATSHPRVRICSWPGMTWPDLA